MSRKEIYAVCVIAAALMFAAACIAYQSTVSLIMAAVILWALTCLLVTALIYGASDRRGDLQ
jgi:nucleoside permease NupC